MFLVKSFSAKLRRFNRDENNKVYDDQNYEDTIIRCCPYNIDQKIKFGVYTHPEATGYYQIPRDIDVRQGDQLMLLGKYEDGQIHTILKVSHGWMFNRIENQILAVK